MISNDSNFFSIHTINSATSQIITMYKISLFLSQNWWLLLFSSFLYQSSNADNFHIVTSPDTPCPGEFSGVPCVSLQQYVSNPSISTGNITLLFQTGNHTLASAFSASSASSYTLTGEDINIECVSSAVQWNFLSIQQVHMRGISFFRCHGGMTFRNIEMLTMESIKVQYSDNRYSRTPNSPITITNVAQAYITRSDYSNNYNNYNSGISNGGVFNIRNSSIEICSSIFHNNYAHYSGGVLYVDDNNLRGTHQNRITITKSTFTNNRARYSYGGAIYIRHSLDYFRYGRWYYHNSVVLSISNSSFKNNRVSYFDGGAVYYYSDEELTVTQSNFTNSYARHGGAVYSKSSVSVTNCYFSDNTATQKGAGIYSISLTTITSSNFSSNRASTQGGAIYSLSELACENCVFLNNLAADGGAVFVNDSSSFTSCEFYNNSAHKFGGAIHITGIRSSTSVLDGIFVNNTAVTLGGAAIYSNSRYSNVSISSSTFTHNTASYCSVLDVDDYYHFNVSITDSVFTSNTATGTLLGGGVACIRNASVTVRGSAFRHNHAILHGGVFHLDESRVIVDGSVFLNNSATANGGVFYTYLHPSGYEVRRSEFSYNSAGEDGGVLYIGRVNSRVTVSQCVFTYNEASDRGGVAALIGSSLYIDVNRTHIFNNTARLGGIISACNSEVNVGAGELFRSTDPVYSFCTLYDGDLINYNVSNDITPTSSINAEQSYSSTLLQRVESPTSSFSLKSVTLSAQNQMSAHYSLDLIPYQSKIHTSKSLLMRSAKVNVIITSSNNFHLLSTTPVEMLLPSTYRAQSSQLPSPTTSIKLSYPSQTSASLNTNHFNSTFSTSLNRKQVTDIIPTHSSTLNKGITVVQSLSLSTTSVISSPQLLISTTNSKLSLSSQTSPSPTINNNILTDPTSQNIKPDTELLTTTTTTISLSSDLMSRITLALVLLWYVVVMIVAVITGIYFIRRFYQKHSHKLSNFSLHEQGNAYEYSMNKTEEKEMEEKNFNF